MGRIKIYGPQSPIDADLSIGGSKSISNRVLLIRALCEDNFSIDNLSDSDDTETMLKLIDSDEDTYDVHHAGTCFRFLTARLAITAGEQLLTGSSRMLQRPIGPLVDALRTIGADIEYRGADGYPPLLIRSFNNQMSGKVSIDAGMSSQFISALCMIAPVLPHGLEIELTGDLVSRSYLEMTLSIMSDFGIQSTFADNTIEISHQKYVAKDYVVESDWSSVSYQYAIAALSKDSKINLSHYFKNSYQGDSRVIELYKNFGVTTVYNDGSISIKSDGVIPKVIKYDFINQPDLAQTYAVMAAALGVELHYKGVQTLAIKETDRMSALATELAKVGVTISKSDGEYEYVQTGKAVVDNPIFDTYQDHRMAMAIAPLAIINPIYINDPEVVTKSYPNYWNDLATLGFEITSV